MVLGAGLAGSLALGALTDAAQRRHPSGRLFTFVGLGALSLAATTAFYLLPPASPFFLASWLLAQAWTLGWFGPMLAAIHEKAPAGSRATVIGFSLMTINLVGVASGPWVTGVDRRPRGAHDRPPHERRGGRRGPRRRRARGPAGWETDDLPVDPSRVIRGPRSRAPTGPISGSGRPCLDEGVESCLFKWPAAPGGRRSIPAAATPSGRSSGSDAPTPFRRSPGSRAPTASGRSWRSTEAPPCGRSPTGTSAPGPSRGAGDVVPARRSGSFRITAGASGRGASSATSSSIARFDRWAARSRMSSRFSVVRCGASFAMAVRCSLPSASKVRRRGCSRAARAAAMRR